MTLEETIWQDQLKYTRLNYTDMKDLKQHYLDCYWSALNHNKPAAVEYYGKRAIAILHWCLVMDGRA